MLSADDAALLYLLRTKSELFPTQPVVFFGVNNIALARKQNARKDITGVIETVSMKETVQMMLDIQPETKHILALVDNTPSGLSKLSTFQQLAPAFPQVVFEELSLRDYSFSEFAHSLQTIDRQTAVLLLSAYVDKTGKRLLFEESLKLIVSNLQIPLYHLWNHGIGEGIFGGKVISHEEQGKRAAEIVVQILEGKPVETIPVVDKSPNRYVVDYDLLKKFTVDEEKLPKNTLFINKLDSLYARYTYPLSFGAFFFISLLLIIFFLIRIIQKNKKNRRYPAGSCE